MKRSVRLALVLVITVPLLVVQYLIQHRHHHGGRAAAPAAAATVAVKPAPPRTWKLGSLTLTACELGQSGSGTRVGAWCTHVDVPENRADPSGRHIKLRLAVVRSEAQVTPGDMVVLLAGGPGQAATETYRAVAPALSPLLRHRDVVLLDQRGTGGSHPLTCKPSTPNTDLDRHAVTDNDRLRAAVQACLQQLKGRADPRYYTTTDAVADLEHVRQLLGSPRFDLVGISYGTRMAQQYAMRHPQAVRSMVLDGVVPNRLVLGEDFAVNLEQALKKDFAACVADPSCHKRFGDPYQTLETLRAQLKAQPRQVSFRDPQTFATVTRTLDDRTLATVVRLFAYTPETTALLPLSIDAAAHGDATPLLGQARLIRGDLDASINDGMQMSVSCSEDADLLKPRPQDAGTILGDTLIKAMQTECAIWPHGRMPADFHQPLKSAIPTLLLSGSRDPVTPPRYAAEVASHLSDARSLVLKGQGHNVITRGCAPKLVRRFIDDLKPKQLDATCLKRLHAPPAFIDFNGAAP